jgi:signal transduction histidine kinase/DNA-binding response OmpR family regulator
MKRFLRTILMQSRPLRVLLIIIPIIALNSCSTPTSEKKFTIGFSQCVESDMWRKTMLEGMKRELSFHPSIDFLYKQADGNSQKQVQQVKELLAQKVDLLIISPNEAEPLTPIVEDAFNRGTPVIVVDRKISSSLYTAYVGADNYEIGKMAGQYASHLLKGRGNIIEITGLPKSSPAIERHKGFFDAIKSYPELNIVQQLNGEWLKQQAKNEISKVSPDAAIDLVYAHNDMMAMGAHEVFASRGIKNKTKIIGVDGLPGNGGGMESVSDKTITATMLYPTGGEEAIQIAMRILNKEDYKKDNTLQTTVIDSTNVRLMELQASKVTSQQVAIERQQVKLSEQARIYSNQQTYLYILVSSLILAVCLGGIAFYSSKENRNINKKLKLQNLEISRQKDQLVDMSAKAQAANEAKVNFFTNISHEFRTPLTLILGPLEELLANSKNQSNKQSLVLIQKNVFRLLRLFNQLIDFRKIEVGKMQLKATENDLISFVSEIVNSYKSIANKKNIDLRIITAENHLSVWFDVNMFDKVIFNLLSNAFKFTKENGYVHVNIFKNPEKDAAIIKVEDNGVGMTKECLNHAFEAFAQGEHEKFKGSGLGLALSKELIQLHKGSIKVHSELGRGTNFEIILPLGKAHLGVDEIKEREAKEIVLYENEKVYTTELETALSPSRDTERVSKEKEASILVIEDNKDLREFLKQKFDVVYEILEADNGQSALQQAFDTVPDLIICDVVIPGKDGLTLLNIFKNDIRTSHIPIILLTARTGIDIQIEGMKNMADVYMTKPFNLHFLEQTIKSLLANRARLKEHFTGEFSPNLNTQTIGKLDRKFISEFSSLVESNISNEDFNVEDIIKNMGISRVQLYRKVKALLSLNVNDYILNARLQKAKYCLQHEEMSISEIAYQVGFSSPAYFSTVFKSKFGVTPREFKDKKVKV